MTFKQMLSNLCDQGDYCCKQDQETAGCEECPCPKKLRGTLCVDALINKYGQEER